MMKGIKTKMIIAVVSLLFCVVGCVQQVAKVKNAVLIGWDGCQRQHLKECMARNEVPNLLKLADEGNLVAIDILRTTDTKAGWTQILTGMEPEKTGVFSNGRYQPIPVGYTIFERLEKHFGPDKICTVAIIGKKGHVDDGPPKKIRMPAEGEKPKGKKKKQQRRQEPGSKIVEENGVKYQVVPGKPYYQTKDHMDVFINGLKENDKVGELALEHLERCKDRRFFFFIHFAEPDHVGHAHGENSKEYNDGIISDDMWTGKIVARLKELGLYDKTLIYVTADHGFDEGEKSHKDAPHVFLGTNDPEVIRRGERCDIAPTIMDRLGLDLKSLNPPVDGRPLTKPYQPPKW
ncbi:MAG: alkaline phosphatase family protein [Planctomycetota bacterium]